MILKDAFEKLMEKESMAEGEKTILKAVFMAGAAAVARYTFFTKWASVEEYSHTGDKLVEELKRYGKKNLLDSNPWQEVFTAPRTGESFEVKLTHSGETAQMSYNQQDGTFYEVSAKGSEGSFQDLDGIIEGWRPKGKSNALMLPDGYENMESAPKDGRTLYLISGIPKAGPPLSYFAFFDQVTEDWQSFTKHGHVRVRPIAWHPAKSAEWDKSPMGAL